MFRTIFTTLWPLWNLEVFGTELAVLAETLSYAFHYALHYAILLIGYWWSVPSSCGKHLDIFSKGHMYIGNAVCIPSFHNNLQCLGNRDVWNYALTIAFYKNYVVYFISLVVKYVLIYPILAEYCFYLPTKVTHFHHTENIYISTFKSLTKICFNIFLEALADRAVR